MSYPVASTPDPAVHVTRPSGSAPMSPQQWAAYGTALVDEFLAQVLMAVASIDVAGTHPFIGLQQWGQQLENAAQNALLSAQGAQSTANGAYGDFQNYVSGNYTGITTPMAGLIPSSRIVNTTPNLQVDPSFDTTAALAGSSDWTLDTAVGHDAPGSGSTVLNGTDRSLLGTIVPVQPGNVISLELWVKWQALVCAAGATPIQLQIEPDSGPPVLIAGITGPAASSDWTQLTGTYTVQPGVSKVRLRVLLTGDATGGTVWVDDASLILSGGFLDALSSDTQNVINALTNGGTSSEVSEAWNNLLGLFSLAPGDMTQAQLNAQTVWANTINTVIADLNLLVATGDYHPLLNVLFGSTATPTATSTLNHSVMPGTFADLGPAFHQLVTDMANPFGGGWENLGADFARIVSDLTGGTVALPTPAAVVVPQTSIDQSTGWLTTIGATQGTHTSAIDTIVNATVGAFDPSLAQSIDNFADGVQSFINGLFGQTTTPPATATPTAGFIGQAHSAAATAQSTAVAASSNAQGVIDSINNAVNGGNATGTPLSQVAGNLTQIPQNNIKVNPASGSPNPVTFDAAGAGAASGPYSVTQNGTTVSWTHVVGAAANYLLVPVYYPGPMQPAAPSFTGTATRSSDGQQFMLPQITFADDTNVLTMLGALIEPGTYTIAVTSNVVYPNTGPGFVCASSSYCNVNTVGITTAHSSGSASTAMSLSFPSQPNNARALAVVYWGNTAPSSSAAKITALTGVTQRFSDTFTTGSTGTAIALGDVIPAGTNTSFGATAASGSGNAWMGTEILLEPPSTTVGSFARVSRENTTAVTVALGATTIPAGAYDTTVKLSSDITLENSDGSSTANGCNQFKVTYAGTYMFEIGVDFSPAITSNNAFMFESVVNGVAQLMDYTVALTYQGGAVVRGVIYLDPNSTVTWTGTNLTTAAAWGFTGNGNGISWMSLALMNRSLL